MHPRIVDLRVNELSPSDVPTHRARTGGECLSKGRPLEQSLAGWLGKLSPRYYSVVCFAILKPARNWPGGWRREGGTGASELQMGGYEFLLLLRALITGS